MSSKWRRFEVLLPPRFNDGREVPPEWLAEAVLEVVDHFGAASYETQKVEGHWRHAIEVASRAVRARRRGGRARSLSTWPRFLDIAEGSGHTNPTRQRGGR